MWLKLFILFLYLVTLFILTRLLEISIWEVATVVGCSKLVDPVKLGVRQLKTLLNTRGINYNSILEKGELSQLIQDSGEVSEAEICEANYMSTHDGEDLAGHSYSYYSVNGETVFSGSAHFYEQVEDAKDSVWLVQVRAANYQPLLSTKDWHIIHNKVSPFGVRTGYFNCQLDLRICNQKGWHSSRLILGLPRGNRPKDSVVLHTYSGPLQTRSVLKWIWSKMAHSVVPVNIKNVSAIWKEIKTNEKQVKVFHLSQLLDTSLLLAALGVKFSGRISFAHMRHDQKGEGKTANSKHRRSTKPINDTIKQTDNMGYGFDNQSEVPFDLVSDEEAEMLEIPSGAQLEDVCTVPKYMLKKRDLVFKPGIVIATPEGVFRFREPFNMVNLELLLKWLSPDMNDAFLITCCLTNFFGFWDAYLNRGGVLSRYGIISIMVHNLCILLVWVMVATTQSTYMMTELARHMCSTVRIFAQSRVAEVIRRDWIYWKLRSHHLMSALVLMTAVFGFVLSKLGLTKVPQQRSATSGGQWFWLPPSLNSFILSWFFRPTGRPTEVVLEEEMRVLLERITVPRLWLKTELVDLDYIDELPVWVFCGWGRPAKPKSTPNDEDTCTLMGLKNKKRRWPPRPSEIFPSTPTQLQLQKEEGKAQVTSVDAVQGSQEPGVITKKLEVFETPNSSSSECSDDECSHMNAIPGGMLETTECAICLEQYRKGTVLCGLPCGHNYHQRCIKEWLYRDNHHCPHCRRPTYQKAGMSELYEPDLNYASD